jgi:hypothetical protein
MMIEVVALISDLNQSSRSPLLGDSFPSEYRNPHPVSTAARW